MLNRMMQEDRGIIDLPVLYVFLVVLFIGIGLIIDTGMAMISKYDTVVVSRETARIAAITPGGTTAAINKAEELFQGFGRPINYDGHTLFDKSRDVDINLYDGEYVTSTVTYRHPWIITDIGKIFGSSSPRSPYDAVTATTSFRREW